MATKIHDSEQVLFEANYPRVFRSVLLFCNSYSLAEEATQEAFYLACKNLHQLRNKSSFPAWVTSIAINVLKKEFNNQKKVSYVDFEKVNYELACNNNDYEIVELKDEVRQMLNSLDDSHREVLILRYMFGLSLSEISDMKDLSTGTVKSRIFRAREKLRKFAALGGGAKQ
ncbi:RNA polymerase sigma factor [Dethiobacter alkaliphilus]|uniref:RNA polymerase sigma factor n=1 Tax=Dethiobacter alkaliphilus TaxID=427926 RepID=UPI002225B731|nr:RNA polymerase sigma factor [Dethiobacter alkaliphilus]MCW3491526.1 RNA polymerase sigma factor [Dethiobacter alkaliphilus]